jgi:hypothetical protein
MFHFFRTIEGYIYLFSKELIIKSSFFKQKDLQDLFAYLQKLGKKVAFELRYNNTVTTACTIEDIEKSLNSIEFPLSSINILVGENSFDSERIEIRLDCKSEGSSSYSNRVKIQSEDESFVRDNEIFLNGILYKYETGLMHQSLYNKELFVFKWLITIAFLFSIIKLSTLEEVISAVLFPVTVGWWAVVALEWILKQFFPYLAIETEKTRPKSVKIKAFLQTRFLDCLISAVIGVMLGWFVQRYFSC